MGLTGNTVGLRKLAARFTRMSSPAFARGLATQLAEEARDLVVRCLDSSTDPYGRPYAPLVSRRGKPLEKTGVMRNSITYRATSNGFQVLTGVLYATFHNAGTKVIPRRQFIPTRGLPAAWRRQFLELADEYVERFMLR